MPGCGGQGLYCSAVLLLCIGKVKLRLEVEPELGIDAKPVPEAQGRVASHGPLAGDYLADAVGRDIDLSGEGGLAYTKLVQFILEYLARVYYAFKHLTILCL